MDFITLRNGELCYHATDVAACPGNEQSLVVLLGRHLAVGEFRESRFGPRERTQACTVLFMLFRCLEVRLPRLLDTYPRLSSSQRLGSIVRLTYSYLSLVYVLVAF